MRFALMLAAFGGATVNLAATYDNIWFRLVGVVIGFSLLWTAVSEGNKAIKGAIRVHELEKSAKRVDTQV